MTRSQNISALIHRTRGTWTTDTISELVEAVRAASPQEAQLALVQYAADLMKAARSTVQAQLAAEKADSADDADDQGVLQ